MGVACDYRPMYQHTPTAREPDSCRTREPPGLEARGTGPVKGHRNAYGLSPRSQGLCQGA